LSPGEDLHPTPVGSNPQDSSSAFTESSSVSSSGIHESEITDRNIEPAVDSHADAVGRVIRTTFGDLFRTYSRYKHFLPIRRSVTVFVMEHA
jgi:hypothetical protein